MKRHLFCSHLIRISIFFQIVSLGNLNNLPDIVIIIKKNIKNTKNNAEDK